MTAHPGCADPELLSAYLDGELAGGELRQVEGHLAGCPACADRLAGLHRVVGSLAGLERAVPPPALGLEVARRAARARRQPYSLEQLEERLRTLGGAPPLLTGFAVVLALATLFFLIAYGVERQGDRGTSIVVLDPETSREVEAVLEDRDPWTRRVASRLFERRGDRWVEASLAVGSGLEADPPVDLAIGADSAEGRERLARNPGLASLLEDAVAVVFVDRGETVALHTRPSTPPAI